MDEDVGQADAVSKERIAVALELLDSALRSGIRFVDTALHPLAGRALPFECRDSIIMAIAKADFTENDLLRILGFDDYSYIAPGAPVVVEKNYDAVQAIASYRIAQKLRRHCYAVLFPENDSDDTEGAEVEAALVHLLRMGKGAAKYITTVRNAVIDFRAAYLEATGRNDCPGLDLLLTHLARLADALTRSYADRASLRAELKGLQRANVALNRDREDIVARLGNTPAQREVREDLKRETLRSAATELGKQMIVGGATGIGMMIALIPAVVGGQANLTNPGNIDGVQQCLELYVEEAYSAKRPAEDHLALKDKLRSSERKGGKGAPAVPSL